jgi:hypothetical protein
MYFAKYEIKRVKKRFALEEDMRSIYTFKDIEEIRQGQRESQKYESFFVLEMRCIPAMPLDTKMI